MKVLRKDTYLELKLIVQIRDIMLTYNYYLLPKEI
jgi:hypothetical protein